MVLLIDYKNQWINFNSFLQIETFES